MVSMESPDWPFEDDSDTQVITLRQILDSERPILSVFRDISDRGWQFLIGEEEPDIDDGRISNLHCMFATDPSIADLTDLPLGWFAWRDKPGEPWQRAPHHADDWDELIAESLESLDTMQAALQAEYSIDSCDSVDLEQEPGSVLLLRNGSPSIAADVLVVGSLTKTNDDPEATGTWRWAWDDPDVEDETCAGLENVAEYGHSVGLEKLSNPTLSCSEEDAWALTAIAAEMLDAQGAYKARTENGTVYMLLSDPQAIG